MKKKISYILLLVLFFVFSSVDAKDYLVSPYILNLRKGPSTATQSIIKIPVGETVNRTDEAVYESNDKTNCPNGFIKINYKTYTGFVCIDYVREINNNPIPSTPSILSEEEWMKYFNEQNFPESYKKDLLALHKKYPNWIFKRVETAHDWNTTLDNEEVPGRSLYGTCNRNRDGWLSTAQGNYDWFTDTFKSHDSSCWFQANRQLISHYMDPRNYFNEEEIFVFEHLRYNKTTNDRNVIYNFLPNHMKKYTDYFLEAGNIHNVSPIYLAAKSLMEVGTNPANPSISGQAGSYVYRDGVNYNLNRAYNFFNIGAHAGNDSARNGLVRAVKEGWVDDASGFQVMGPKKAIIGGTNFLKTRYIAQNQDTNYFQKWNVSKNRLINEYYYQYMTDIAGASGISKKIYSMYKSNNILNHNFTFLIPVFNNMPHTASGLPDKRNPNNWLKTLNINNQLVSGFESDKVEYNLTYNNIKQINISGLTVSSKARIEGLGIVNLNNGLNVVNIRVIAENGSIKDYKLNITANISSTNPSVPNPPSTENLSNLLTKSNYAFNDGNYITNIGINKNVESFKREFDSRITVIVKNSDNSIKNNGFIGTNDIITFRYNSEEISYRAVIYGDINGDGKINTLDLLIVQKQILNLRSLSTFEYIAADVSRDRVVNTLDLLKVQKDILDIAKIYQR
jgi:mannosyl-glycoprotein endo-beta-N-acetylglucosaminidase